MKTKFELTDSKTGRTLFKDQVQAVSTYGSPIDPYATLAAEANSTEQIAVESSDRIIARLAKYFEKEK